MADPHVAAATLGSPGQFLPTLAAAFAATLGVPLGLVGWAFAGGVFTLFKTSFPADDTRLMRAWRVGVHLGLATGIGAVGATTAADLFIAVSTKAGLAIADTPVQDIAAALFLSILAPDVIRRLSSMVGGAP